MIPGTEIFETARMIRDDSAEPLTVFIYGNSLGATCVRYEVILLFPSCHI